MNKNLKIGVVGLGLIGGSIFKALCALKCNVYGVSKSNQTIKKALEYTSNVSKSMLTLKECDIVFVCTPMNKTLEILDKLEDILPQKTIVTDACSLKRFVAKKERPYVFIPSHPMAGTEFSGFDASFESLFQGAKWVLTPFKGTKKTALKELTSVIDVLGARPILTTPEKHDEAAALISHMPMIVAQGIFKTAHENSLAMKLASSGFRDMTRLSLSNEEMAKDMVDYNSDYIQTSLLNLYASIGKLLEKNYINQVKDIKHERQCLYVDGKNIL